MIESQEENGDAVGSDGEVDINGRGMGTGF